MCMIRLEDVDLDNRNIIGGMKTEAGRDRVVPICDKILPCIEKAYAYSNMLGSRWLFCDSKGEQLTYDKYRHRFENALKDIGMEGHRPHDCRKHFITMAKNKGVDEYAIKMMVGHAISDITEKVYTDRPEGWLLDEVNKI